MAKNPDLDQPHSDAAAHADAIGGPQQVRWRTRRVIFAAAIFVLVALGLYAVAPYILPVYVKEGPLIQEAGPDRATVVWFLSRPAKVEFYYHDAQFDVACPVVSGSQTKGGDPTRCAAVMSNLQAGRSYEYFIKQGARTLVRYTLRTDKTADQAYSFIAFGDSGTGTRDQYVLASEMAVLNPDFLIHTGDLVYNEGDRSKYSARFFKPYAGMIRQVAFWPSLGNHDHSDDKHPNSKGYLQVFDLPHDGPPGRPPEEDYWFDYASSRFVVIDSNDREKMVDSVAPWVISTLRDAPVRWRFAVFHHPPYTAGHYPPDQFLQDNLVPALEEARVDIVFNGHDHMYQRTLPISNGQVVPEGQGPIYVITAAGGARLYEPAPERPAWLATLNNKVHSFTIVTIDGPVLTLKQINGSGDIIDQFAIRKE